MGVGNFMKIAYFDCSSGVSGDMILASFLDAGLDFKYLEKELKKLKLAGYSLKKAKVKKQGFPATKFEVILKSGGYHSGRSLKQIKGIINKSRLNSGVKSLAIKIFENITRAECSAHKVCPSEIHFHEIGGTDSLIDIVGAAIAIDYFKIGNAYSSPINVGSGIVNTAHGTLPVPAPATVELLKGVPVYSRKDMFELATPTGVAILKTVCGDFGDMPLMKIKDIGVAAGAFNTQAQPNILRLFLGERDLDKGYDRDSVIVAEANIDDMNLVGTGYIMDQVFKAGALDAYFTPVYMKKTRMGILLSVVTYKENLKKVIDKIFEETTTFGIRVYETQRYKLPRSFKKIKTKYGALNIKIGKVGDKVISASAEYEDCRKLAKDRNIPLKKIYEATAESKRQLADFT